MPVTPPGLACTGVECDVSNPAAVEALMEAAQQLLGGTDVVINNAGYSGSFQVWWGHPP